MKKAGRYTAAITLVAVGGAVILDKLTGSDWTAALISWWPLLFIFLGLEYLWLNMQYRGSDKDLKLDFAGVIFAVILSAVVIMGAHSADFMKKMGDLGSFDLSDAMDVFTDGQKFDKGVTSVPLDAGIENVKVWNKNGSGNVNIRSGDVPQIQINLTVYVQSKDDAEARRIADQSVIDHEVSGNTLTIQAAGQEYGGFIGKHRPRMDLDITVPAKQKVNYETILTNGKLTASGLPVLQRFQAKSTNGEIQASGLAGTLELETTNGQLTVSGTSGPINLKTTNGAIHLTGHHGDAVMKTTNGGLNVEDVTGAIQANTNNGTVKVNGVTKDLKVKSNNGSVDIASRTVGGNWDVDTDDGSITVKLPPQGDYSLTGEGDSMESSLPFTSRDKKSVRGTVGAGRYKIQLETKGSLIIQSAD